LWVGDRPGCRSRAASLARHSSQGYVRASRGGRFVWRSAVPLRSPAALRRKGPGRRAAGRPAVFAVGFSPLFHFEGVFVMSTKIAINGFGRIGRCIVRAMTERQIKDLQLVAINDLTDAKTLAHLFNYDTVHGRAKHRAKALEGALDINGQQVKILAEKDPGKLPWKALGVDVVLECTGLFTDKEKASTHLAGGAKKVLISAPAKDQDATLVLGVNQENYDPAKHHIVSNGSCTTNCLAPVAKVMLDAFGIKHGLMTTVHSYTNDQAVLDIPHRKGDLRRARAAAQNIIPSTTGAAKALSEVIPSLKGKFDGSALRVPTMDVSIVDLTLETEKPATKDAIHAAMKAAAEGPMKGILGFTEELLVSSDYIGDPRSSIFDATMTQVMGERFCKVFSWYDNEWGFSNRMIELAQLVAAKL
jgi:glyceraldehyde 3-phosphate dehydrogenase